MIRRSSENYRLSELIEIRHGFAFQSKFFGNHGDYLLLTPGNFNETGGFRKVPGVQKRYSGPVPPDFILDEGDVLVAMTEQSPGLLGSSLKIPRGNVYLHNQRLGFVEIKRPNVIAKGYLYHLFNAPHVRKEISTKASGTKVKHTSPKRLCSIVTTLPPIHEQEEMASLLDTWDTAIENIDRLVSAKERFYAHQLSQFIRWERYPRSDVGAVANEVSKRNRFGNRERVLSVTNTRGFVLAEDQFERRVASADISNYKVVVRGQFAYNPSRINVGSIARLDGWDIGVLSPMYVVFELNASKVNSDYFWHWLNSHEAEQRIQNSTQGTVRESVSFADLSAIAIPLPALERQTTIANYLNCLRGEIGILNAKLEKQKRQKRGLMQELFTGQWRLKLPESAAV